jgi:hypothetical protein
MIALQGNEDIVVFSPRINSLLKMALEIVSFRLATNSSDKGCNEVHQAETELLSGCPGI